MVVDTKLQECPICYEFSDCCIPLECGHLFCEECLSETINHYNVMNDEFMCPYCRHEIKSIDNEELNKQLKELHLRISIRKEEENNLYGLTTYLIMCFYWFPDDPNIHNYPKKMRFYTYEELI
jgi:hypothetical protein